MILKTIDVPGIELEDIQPFIFNWRNQFENTCVIEDALKAIFDVVIVINSDETRTRPGWIDLGSEAYFSAQFRKALELFDAQVLMHIQGDVSYHDWRGVIESARRYYALYEWGVFAPNIDDTWYREWNTDIYGIELPEPNLKMCASTDETAWLIHKDVIDEFHRMNIARCFDQNTMGWGWDLVFCGISFLMRRPVIRDYDHTVAHPRGRGYNRDLAVMEMDNLVKALPETLAECISYIQGDRENIAQYFAPVRR
jgi:hypothetical protein